MFQLLISIILFFSQATWINYDALQLSFSRSNSNISMVCIEKKSPMFPDPIHIDCVNTPTNDTYTYNLLTGRDHKYIPRVDDEYRIIEYQKIDNTLELLYGEWFTISNKRPSKYQQILPIVVK